MHTLGRNLHKIFGPQEGGGRIFKGGGNIIKPVRQLYMCTYDKQRPGFITIITISDIITHDIAIPSSRDSNRDFSSSFVASTYG